MASIVIVIAAAVTGLAVMFGILCLQRVLLERILDPADARHVTFVTAAVVIEADAAESSDSDVALVG